MQMHLVYLINELITFVYHTNLMPFTNFVNRIFSKKVQNLIFLVYLWFTTMKLDQINDLTLPRTYYEEKATILNF